MTKSASPLQGDRVSAKASGTIRFSATATATVRHSPPPPPSKPSAFYFDIGKLVIDLIATALKAADVLQGFFNSLTSGNRAARPT